MRDKNFSRQAALFFTFAGMLLSQTPDSAPQDVTVTPTARLSKVASPTKPTLATTGSRADHPLTAPKLNTMMAVQDQGAKHSSSFGIGPGELPLYVRLHPISATEMYGAAPAVVRLRFGQK